MKGQPRPRPRWCGQCDYETRLVDLGGTAARCPRCHASTQPGGRHAPALTRPPRVVAIEFGVRD